MYTSLSLLVPWQHGLTLVLSLSSPHVGYCKGFGVGSHFGRNVIDDLIHSDMVRMTTMDVSSLVFYVKYTEDVWIEGFLVAPGSSTDVSERDLVWRQGFAALAGVQS